MEFHSNSGKKETGHEMLRHVAKNVLNAQFIQLCPEDFLCISVQLIIGRQLWHLSF